MGVYGGGELPAHTAGRIVSHEPFSPIASFLLAVRPPSSFRASPIPLPSGQIAGCSRDEIPRLVGQGTLPV